jgi:predicted nucleic acid-binding protein
LIYYLEASPTYLPLVDPFFAALDRAELHTVTSTVTLVEVLTLPFRLGDVALAQRYRELLLGSTGLTVVAISHQIAEDAARLRADYGFRTPHALQLATARVTGARYCLTNDTDLKGIPGLHSILLDQILRDE